MVPGIRPCSALTSEHTPVTEVPLTAVMTCDTLSTCEAGDPGAIPKTSAPASCSFGVYPRYVSAAAFACAWAWLISKNPCGAS